MLSELLTKVRQYRSQATTEITDGYKALVTQLADDQDVTAEEIVAALDTAGKTEEELAKDVETLLNRRTWADQLRQSQDAAKALQKAEADIEKITLEMNRELAKYTSRLDQARAARSDAERLQSIYHQAQSNLSATCTDQALLAREQEVSDRLKTLIPAERELVHEIRKAETTVGAIAADVERYSHDYRNGFTPAAREHAARAIEGTKVAHKNHQANLRRLKSEAAEIRAEITRLQSELERIAAARLIP